MKCRGSLGGRMQSLVGLSGFTHAQLRSNLQKRMERLSVLDNCLHGLVLLSKSSQSLKNEVRFIDRGVYTFKLIREHFEFLTVSVHRRKIF
ncbi:hypothetical protein HanRHA438_Chr07g0306511 [Helianthus annuus]|nr:hypothetical protein HanRHA438_Chr07g0306511 [Helianthus annuus]